MTAITENEILEALRAAAVTDVDDRALTAGELQQRLGWGEKRVRRYLVDLKRDGRVEVLSVVRETLDGRRGLVPGYRLRET